ncbi:MAG TPA: Mur ligase family protein, partial [Thermomicrobiales bacterium]|nr:Mur ligase family protein [Thermomicrobiales bacterium]
MNICEVRDLDGPNLFLRKPAIKLEFAAQDGAFRVSALAEALAAGVPARDEGMPPATPERVMSLLIEIVHVLHDRCDLPRPETVSRPLEERHHYAVAFTWSHRRFAMALGKLALRIVLGEDSNPESGIVELKSILASSPEDDDAPEMVADCEGHIPIVAITGTNGKTTTSRLIASILRQSGKTVGLTSSVGVFIGTEKVLEGDYSGPAGAHRVLEDDRVDVAVLETARGGMLLRGLGFECSEVSVVTNVSADHLGLHGILTIEGLAEVKSLVPRSTRRQGFAVLNADDPRVLAMRDQIEARPFLVTRRPMSDAVREHVADGGWALTVDDGQIQWRHDGEIDVLTSLGEIPITFGGRAPHMVENALCAAAACVALGLDIDQVQFGLAAFQSSSRDNHGRLNVYGLNGGTVV